ncbi:GH36-type glycosyl hydrolase domain-containing protein [Listeria fleischmannii]|uniref:Cellobiose phosphorylase n=1 Tax=Listeria fleischmannii TaxID=1069827 RepID=A0A841YGW1_9LIST|nr:amylo-alpha-1,6-glucosidase [Listeria fleischmannii]MBC1399460.1 cellobiose phosphorylase [Listeria fleischmannii]MBC1427812.1 cellobiose phosphorylase [Listeria fleischmannii]
MITTEKGLVKAKFFETGHMHALLFDGVLVNQVLQNPLETRLGQIFLRTEAAFYPLLNEEATFSYHEEAFRYEGTLPIGTYAVTFRIHESGWFYECETDMETSYDLIYVQDLGLADVGAVRTNEAYMAQYIDYNVLDTERGKVVLARQNQPQSGNQFPAVELGSFRTIKRFVTDGFDFYGTGIKLGESPQGLIGDGLKNRKWQYEMAMVGLQTDLLHGQEKTVFYGFLTRNQVEATQCTTSVETLNAIFEGLTRKSFKAGVKTVRRHQISSEVRGNTASPNWLNANYAARQFEEKSDNQTLSFFTPEKTHVVLKEKERLVERHHGTILLDQVDLLHPENTLAATVYMSGVFHSHVTLGNTNMNKFSSHQRNALNLLQTSGLRIYLRENEKLHLLTMPTAFEMQTNRAKWIYVLADDTLIVETKLSNGSKKVSVAIYSEQGKKYDFVMTNQISMGPNEYENEFSRVEKNGILFYTPKDNPRYPNLAYHVSGDFDEVTDERFIAESAVGTADLDCFIYTQTEAAHLDIQATLNGEFFAEKEETTEAFYEALLSKFKLSHDSTFAEKYNITAYWYAHQMLIHYASPHGLEQGSGAAWGTRDVSQGPFEFFLATGHKAVLRSLILKVFSHQYKETGDWPQWFMFDKYETIQQEESHGDVIVWPLKMIGDYLHFSGDTSILEESIPYISVTTKSYTDEKETLKAHIEKAVSTIESRFMKGTSLSNYGDGDWDDTLQPANNELKKRMVSSWTVALTYQVMTALGKEMPEGARYETLACAIQEDFKTYMLQDTDVIPGFIYMKDEHTAEFMIHPKDKETKIDYRLIPLTRSVIAELVSDEQRKKNFNIIEEHLLHPDGVRLMSAPAHYAGGVSKHFKRAEQAANFGREVGLQYVHAHIRYIESLAKIGDDRAAHMLDVINPIQISEVVKNAVTRQSNTYFSSSDAAFLDRYAAQDDFSLVKKGSIPVKGGWRIYSSGPGIYLNQLIRSVLGIRETKTYFEFDPILPRELDGLSVNIELSGRMLHVTFKRSETKGITFGGKTRRELLPNPYREGALFIPKEELPEGQHELEILFTSI